MFLFALIGAIVFGILMGYAHVNAQKGASWGQPVEVLAGICAIVCSLVAVYANLFGPTEAQKISWGWQKVRGTGIAQFVNNKCSGKKYLVVRNKPWSDDYVDYQYEAIVAQLPAGSFQSVEIGVSDNPEEAMMTPESAFKVPLNAGAKKLAQKVIDRYEAAVGSIDAKSFDVVIFVNTPQDYVYMPKSVSKMDPVKAFDGKKFVFAYKPNYRMLPLFLKALPSVLAYTEDKSLSKNEDYEKGPSGNQDTDFAFRYEMVENPSAAK